MLCLHEICAHTKQGSLICISLRNLITIFFFLQKIIIKSRLSLIVWVNVVLNRIVVVDSDSHCQQQQSHSGLLYTDDQTQPTFEMTPRFKPFTKNNYVNDFFLLCVAFY